MEVRINWSFYSLRNLQSSKKTLGRIVHLFYALRKHALRKLLNPRCRAWKQRLLLPNARPNPQSHILVSTS